MTAIARRQLQEGLRQESALRREEIGLATCVRLPAAGPLATAFLPSIGRHVVQLRHSPIPDASQRDAALLKAFIEMPIPTPESVKLGRPKTKPDGAEDKDDEVMKTPKRKSKAANKPSVAQEPVEAMAAPMPVEEIVAPPVVDTPAPVAKQAPTFALASHCTVKDAAALKTQLMAIAEIDADLTVDVSAVERIDTSTMQLLCALVHDRALRIQRVMFKGESQSWREAVRLLGVAQCLGYQEGTRA